MKNLCWVLLLSFNAFAVCPKTPAYYNPKVCGAVKENTTSFKTDILRIYLKAEAQEMKQNMDLSDDCQIKLAYSVCGPQFVAQELAENIFYGGNQDQIQELLKRSKKYISPNSKWIRELVGRRSFSSRKEDEIKTILFQEKLLPKDLNLLKFADGFEDQSKVPSELHTLLNERTDFEKRFWDPTLNAGLKSGQATDWPAIFKKYPELLKKLQLDVLRLPTADETQFQTFRLEMYQKPLDQQRGSRMKYLEQKAKAFVEKKIWSSTDTGYFHQVLGEAKPLSNAEVIGLLETLIQGKDLKNFPESSFWELFAELHDESLTNEERQRLMMLLYHLDNKAWTRKALSALSSMDTFITDKMVSGCEIEPDKMRAYFADSYKRFREKNTSNIHARLLDEKLSFPEAQELLKRDFDPTLKVNNKSFLDILVEAPLKGFSQDQILDVIKTGCGNFNCMEHLRMREPSPISRAIEANRPQVLKGFLDFLRYRRHAYDKEDRNYLRKLNKEKTNSKEIKEVLNQAEWI